MRMTQKLCFKCPETKEGVWFESPTRHDLLTFLAIRYFETEYWDMGSAVTGWVLGSDGYLVLLSGSMEIGYLQNASWEE